MAGILEIISILLMTYSVCFIKQPDLMMFLTVLSILISVIGIWFFIDEI